MATKLYQASDGTIFKTKSAAEKRDKLVAAKKKASELGLTIEEIQSKAEAVDKVSPNVFTSSARVNGGWTNLAVHQIESLTLNHLTAEYTTFYITRERFFGEIKETVLFKEVGPSFTEDDLHVGDEFKVKEVTTRGGTKVVEYTAKYTPYERTIIKLEKGEELSEDEIRTLLCESDILYEEEGDDLRWTRGMFTVVEVNGVAYGINWRKGLTEYQEGLYLDQPVRGVLTEKEKVVMVTTFTPEGSHDGEDS